MLIRFLLKLICDNQESVFSTNLFSEILIIATSTNTAHCHVPNLIVVVVDSSRGQPEGSLFNSYYRDVGERATPFPGLLHFTLDTHLIMLS